MTHRHYLTGLHVYGRKHRGFASIGGGVALMLPLRPQIEVEARMGVRLGKERRWVVGGLVRLGWNIFHRERAPMPQLGLFIGYTSL
ncbi:hypothetical protein [Nannocystis sp. SCPEA4]|uniref:hypothetical protein n=1 Tax=Nannocystis sp. SCPEA4 TaxID=2996787 RepID=UPI0022710CC0|nr:hypothetical protein [Nannocystis sp. SCPEA4]MCY1060737.1 hypothetical protein [Nannocystis sp. SCPEA4]